MHGVYQLICNVDMVDEILWATLPSHSKKVQVKKQGMPALTMSIMSLHLLAFNISTFSKIDSSTRHDPKALI